MVKAVGDRFLTAIEGSDQSVVNPECCEVPMTIRVARRLAQAGIVLIMAAATCAPAAGLVPGDYYWTKPHTVATRGSVTIGGHVLHFSADAGTIVLRNRQGQPTGEMFYVAYFKQSRRSADRPISFLFNGGPGSSTAPLLIGAFGPVRVLTQSHALTPPAPYSMVANQYSLLDVSDLVFVDAMGTGFSRIIGKDEGGIGSAKMFYGVDPDAKAFEQFIVRFLAKYDRWNSPKYLIGESYGTTRSAAVAYLLEQNDAIDLNGIVLLSTVLNFDLGVVDQPAENPGVNLPYALALPSYAAVAWYHRMLSNRPARLRPLLEQVQSWAMGSYLRALDAGSRLSRQEETRIATRMSQYTGLSMSYVLRADLRVSGPEFEHQLLLSRGESAGRLDGRFSGPTFDKLAEVPSYDPEISAIGPAYVSATLQYLMNTLRFGRGHRYRFLPAAVGNDWNYLHTPPGQSAPAFTATNVMPDLAAAMSLDPDLKVMVNAGFFDLATPYFAAVYQMRQLPLRRALERNIEFRYYHAGHMIYVAPHALKRLHANIVQFVHSTDGAARADAISGSGVIDR